MSERLIRAAARNVAAMREIPGGEPLMPHVALVREAVTALGWGTMAYRCDSCGFEWDIWLTLGVEGPPSLRDHDLYVASPFTLSSCPAWPVKPGATADERATFAHLGRCEGRMSHVRFADDRQFGELRLIPDDAPRFVLDPWYEAAQLVLSEPALVRARRFHNDASSEEE
jgi:hypothetical protein